MKKAMNQSRLISILNGISIAALMLMMLLLFACARTNQQLSVDSENRFNLTYNANRFMNGSAYLTNEVRAYAATESRYITTITGMRSTISRTGILVSLPCRKSESQRKSRP